MSKKFQVTCLKDLLRLARKLRKERGIGNIQVSQTVAAQESGFADFFTAVRSLPQERPKVSVAALGVTDKPAPRPRRNPWEFTEEEESLRKQCRKKYHSDDIHGWFELSYCSYQITPEAVLLLAGETVKAEFLRLVAEMDRCFDWRPARGLHYRVSCVNRGNRFCKDPIYAHPLVAASSVSRSCHVLPRLVMSSMPPIWQCQMIACLEAQREVCKGIYNDEGYTVKLVDLEGELMPDPLARYRHAVIEPRPGIVI